MQRDLCERPWVLGFFLFYRRDSYFDNSLGLALYLVSHPIATMLFGKILKHLRGGWQIAVTPSSSHPYSWEPQDTHWSSRCLHWDPQMVAVTRRTSGLGEALRTFATCHALSCLLPSVGPDYLLLPLHLHWGYSLCSPFSSITKIMGKEQEVKWTLRK